MVNSNFPVYIVSVNNTPPKAIELVETLIEELPGYNLIHVANAHDPTTVEVLLKSLVRTPEVLICSSQWTAEQDVEIQKLAENMIPGIKTVIIPPGIFAAKGGEAVVEFLRGEFLGLGLRKK